MEWEARRIKSKKRKEKQMKEKEIKKLVSEHLKGLRSARELEELIGKEKMAQFL